MRPDQLVVYDSLRPRRAGRAVSALDGDECGVGGVAVPQSKLELVREDEEIVYCGNCGRVLWEGDRDLRGTIKPRRSVASEAPAELVR